MRSPVLGSLDNGCKLPIKSRRYGLTVVIAKGFPLDNESALVLLSCQYEQFIVIVFVQLAGSHTVITFLSTNGKFRSGQISESVHAFSNSY